MHWRLDEMFDNVHMLSSEVAQVGLHRGRIGMKSFNLHLPLSHRAILL